MNKKETIFISYKNTPEFKQIIKSNKDLDALDIDDLNKYVEEINVHINNCDTIITKCKTDLDNMVKFTSKLQNNIKNNEKIRDNETIKKLMNNYLLNMVMDNTKEKEYDTYKQTILKKYQKEISVNAYKKIQPNNIKKFYKLEEEKQKGKYWGSTKIGEKYIFKDNNIYEIFVNSELCTFLIKDAIKNIINKQNKLIELKSKIKNVISKKIYAKSKITSKEYNILSDEDKKTYKSSNNIENTYIKKTKNNMDKKNINVKEYEKLHANMKKFYKKSELNNIYSTNIESHNKLIDEKFNKNEINQTQYNELPDKLKKYFKYDTEEKIYKKMIDKNINKSTFNVLPKKIKELYHPSKILHSKYTIEKNNNNLTEDKVRKINRYKLTEDAKKIYNNLKTKIIDKNKITKNNYNFLNRDDRKKFKQNETNTNSFRKKTELEYYNNLPEYNSAGVTKKNREKYYKFNHTKTNNYDKTSMNYYIKNYTKKPPASPLDEILKKKKSNESSQQEKPNESVLNQQQQKESNLPRKEQTELEYFNSLNNFTGHVKNENIKYYKYLGSYYNSEDQIYRNRYQKNYNKMPQNEENEHSLTPIQIARENFNSLPKYLSNTMGLNSVEKSYYKHIGSISDASYNRYRYMKVNSRRP